MKIQYFVDQIPYETLASKNIGEAIKMIIYFFKDYYDRFYQLWGEWTFNINKNERLQVNFHKWRISLRQKENPFFLVIQHNSKIRKGFRWFYPSSFPFSVLNIENYDLKHGYLYTKYNDKFFNYCYIDNECLKRIEDQLNIEKIKII